jgi:hypothetical protein
LVHVPDIARVAAVTGTEVFRRAFEQKYASPGATCRDGGAESRIATADD